MVAPATPVVAPPADPPVTAWAVRPAIRATLTQLRTFEAVARLGGVGQAARRLHMAQPTASTQLKDLSQALGLALLAPCGRSVILTAEGELLLQAARDMFDAWQRFEEETAALHGLHRGKLRIAAVTTAEYFLPALIGPFALAHPGIEVELAVENRRTVIERLVRGDDELALMMLPPTDLPLQCWPFLENPLVLVAPLVHPLAQRRRLRLEQLVAQPRLTREAGSGTRTVTDLFLQEQGIDWPARMALGSNEAIKHAVAAGLGLAVLSRHTLARDPALDGLCILPVVGLPIRRMWHLVWRTPRRLSAATQAFLAHLAQERTLDPHNFHG